MSFQTGAPSLGSSGASGSSGIGSVSQDVVGVFNDLEQVFRSARPMSASVREEAKLMEHPLESGAVVTDHMVVQPVGIELTMILKPEGYRDTYQEIRTLYLAGTILTVQTKTGSYPNQIIEAIPHEEDPSVFNTIMMTVRLREILIVNAEFEEVPYQAKKPGQSPTVSRGEVPAAEEPKGSWLSQTMGGK